MLYFKSYLKLFFECKITFPLDSWIFCFYAMRIFFRCFFLFLWSFIFNDILMDLLKITGWNPIISKRDGIFTPISGKEWCFPLGSGGSFYPSLGYTYSELKENGTWANTLIQFQKKVQSAKILLLSSKYEIIFVTL